MIALNANLVRQMNRCIERNQEAIESYQAKNEAFEARLTALQLVEEQQLAAALGSDA